MSKVITFSRQFPNYHFRKGEPTFFVEQFWNTLTHSMSYYELIKLNPTDEIAADLLWNEIPYEYRELGNKFQTIRAGNRFKAGEFFSPRVWSGRPYFTKQIIIADDVEILKTWNFEIKDGCFYLNDNLIVFDAISKNDGFKFLNDFLGWFQYPKPFKGQIICWSNEVKY